PHLALLDLGQDLLQLLEGFFEVLGGGVGFLGAHRKYYNRTGRLIRLPVRRVYLFKPKDLGSFATGFLQVMARPTVYLETTIVSYLAAWPSRDLVRAAQQQVTREWWLGRERFELFISELVLSEASQGDPSAAAERLVFLNEIPLLTPNESTDALAESLI